MTTALLGNPLDMLIVVFALGFLYICGFLAGRLDRRVNIAPVPKARLIRYVGIVR